MLAEIENELNGPAEAYQYINLVLTRARASVTPAAVQPANWSTGKTKEQFRDDIMNEYRFELLGEGEDAHNNRRRGYSYFLTNTIQKNNSSPIFNANIDLRLNTVESQVMTLPIPLIEINTNELID